MGCKLIFIHAVVAQLAEHQLPKLRVTSSSLAYRSKQRNRRLANLIFCFKSFRLVGTSLKKAPISAMKPGRIDDCE